MVIGVVGTRSLGQNNLVPASAFLTQLRHFPPNSRVLRAVTFDTTIVCTTLQTFLSTKDVWS